MSRMSRESFETASVNKSKIRFHRRSRYEDILELVNDNEEALKPVPNRDAVFYKSSNKDRILTVKTIWTDCKQNRKELMNV